MSEYVERIKTELAELKSKMEKLGVFMKSEKFLEVDANNRMLLIAQYSLMSQYVECLELRITLAR